jgi:hypothetical protein
MNKFIFSCGVVTITLMHLNGGVCYASEQKPNIILVMADDQGWGDTGYNGHPVLKTPELDAMARDGFIFDRFYAAAPVCSPTRASVMTGRSPIRAKVPNHGRYMRPHETTLAEVLKAAGYTTGIFGKLHLGSGQPGSPCNPSAMGFDEWVVGLNFFDNDPYLSRNGIIEHRKGKGSVILMDDTIEFLENHKDGHQPIFAVVWFPSPHSPHKETPDDASLYDGEENAGYFREIALLDQQVGKRRAAFTKGDCGCPQSLNGLRKIYTAEPVFRSLRSICFQRSSPWPGSRRSIQPCWTGWI